MVDMSSKHGFPEKVLNRQKEKKEETKDCKFTLTSNMALGGIEILEICAWIFCSQEIIPVKDSTSSATLSTSVGTVSGMFSDLAVALFISYRYYLSYRCYNRSYVIRVIERKYLASII